MLIIITLTRHKKLEEQVKTIDKLKTSHNSKYNHINREEMHQLANIILIEELEELFIFIANIQKVLTNFKKNTKITTVVITSDILSKISLRTEELRKEVNDYIN